MGEHADDAFDEILDYMDFSDQCRDLGIDPSSEDAMDILDQESYPEDDYEY